LSDRVRAASENVERFSEHHVIRQMIHYPGIEADGSYVVVTISHSEEFALDLTIVALTLAARLNISRIQTLKSRSMQRRPLLDAG
jgi:hypothetical protein